MVVQALSPFSVTTRIDRVHCKPWGLHGGHEAAGNGIAIRKDGKWQEDHPNAKIFNVRLGRGDAYKMLSGGGGGFGDPAERDPALVAHDVREGYVSRERAKSVYKVALTAEGQVSKDLTAKLRVSAPKRKTGAEPSPGDEYEVLG
jgi:N-methylhydantoinase B